MLAGIQLNDHSFPRTPWSEGKSNCQPDGDGGWVGVESYTARIELPYPWLVVAESAGGGLVWRRVETLKV